MSWKDAYRSKLCTAEAAVAGLSPGAHVYMGGNAATPRGLCRALAARAAEVPGLTVSHVLLLGDDPLAEAVAAGLIRHRAFFVGPADRAAVASGASDYVPCNLSDIPRLIRGAPLDAALLMTAPPDRHGFLSLGVEVLASLAAAEAAKTVIIQVNPRMPRVHGNAFLHVSEVDHIVEHEEALVTLDTPAPTDVEVQIAGHIVPLIPDGATLQLGIGGVPNAVMSLLVGRTGLGVHSEMISDGVMRAWEAGVLTGENKTLHPRKVVTTFVLGSRHLYDWVDDNPHVEAWPCDVTNDVSRAASNHKLVAINSALSVDLTGQVNADSLGARIYSGVGGQVDFIRAAGACAGGAPIIALPSTAADGTQSRIRCTLALGAGVVTSRADVHYVVTEHGVADLRGKSLRERANALITIAHPSFRDALRAEAREVWRGALG